MLIAVGRMILSAFFLLAIWLDPSEPSRYARLTYGLLTVYVAYSLLIGVLTLRRHVNSGHLQVGTHCIDMLVFALLMFFTAGPSSPFFVYFIFLLVCATLRWQWRGTIWTAGAVLAIVSLLALLALLLQDQNFELNRFIIRTVYLAVVATLLGYLGAHEQSMRKVLSSLAEWPRSVPDDPEAMGCGVLDHAAGVLGAPRLLLAWEEEEEPWLHLSLWSRGGCEYRRERSDIFGTFIAGRLAGAPFFCRNAEAPLPQVVVSSPEGLRTWEGSPLDSGLRERFGIGSVVASCLEGEHFTGHLLVLDKKNPTIDDLVLGGIVAHEISTRLQHRIFLERLRQGAASNERVRLARDLHDGLLQSLTGAALQLETAHRLMETDPSAARQRIREIQRLIAAEQKDLRSHIRELKPLLTDRVPEEFELAMRLEDLAERIRQQWNLTVKIDTRPPAPRVTRNLAREIYFVVHEALINAVRHSGASSLSADLSFDGDRVYVTVNDDGHGFAFRGRYDQDQLLEMKRGPVTLRERIAALGGTITIDSLETGARLEIVLPLADYGG